MPQIPTDQLQGPQYFSILLIGPSKTGKTLSIGSLHRILRLIKKVKPDQSTKMMIFDFDGDGFLPLLRLAKDGRERIGDKPGTCEPWVDDLMVFSYANTAGTLRENNAAPHRPKKPIDDFHQDFNQIDSWQDHKTGLWYPNKGVGAIIYDSLTSLMYMYESYVWASRNKDIGLSGPSAVGWQDWALVGERIRAAYQTAKAFPCFFVATAHEDTRQELIHGSAKAAGPGQPAQPPAPLPNAVWAVPMLTYSLSLSAAGDFGCVVHSTTDRTWIGQPGGRIRSAGSRLKDLPTGEFEQDFAQLIRID